jgi:hypothetical protein
MFLFFFFLKEKNYKNFQDSDIGMFFKKLKSEYLKMILFKV